MNDPPKGGSFVARYQEIILLTGYTLLDLMSGIWHIDVYL